MAFSLQCFWRRGWTLMGSFAVFILSILILGLSACTHSIPAKTLDIEKPLIQNLTTTSPSLQNAQKSLLRFHLKDRKNESSFGTGFFFQSQDLIVTSLHIFDDHPCLENKTCEVLVGLVKDEKSVDERLITLERVLIDTPRDLLFLQIKDKNRFSQVVPLQRANTSQSTHVVAAGFFQDSSSLTFTHGRFHKKNQNEVVSTMIVGHGFSGAPVLNSSGHVVGVVSSFHPLQNQRDIGIARYVELN